MKAVIIDDEPDSVSLLQLMLMRHCPQIDTITSFTSPQKALPELPNLQPDILFLDIEMPGMTAFELLEQLLPISFQVVFVTAYNQYAVKALRMNALDYLVKPVDTDDLVSAVERTLLNRAPVSEQIDLAERQMKGEPVKKIAISTQAGVSFIVLEEIIYAEASNNYTNLIMNNGKRILISKTMKDVQDVLEQSHFLRIHRQYVINLNQVKAYNRNNAILIMADEAELPVARNQKDKLMERYGWL